MGRFNFCIRRFMGISIMPYFYEEQPLIEALKKDGAEDEVLLRKIMEKFGTFLGNKYILLHNEYYQDYNPYFELADVLNSAFDYKGNDGCKFWHTYFKVTHTSGISAASAEEVAEELGIELIREET